MRRWLCALLFVAVAGCAGRQRTAADGALCFVTQAPVVPAPAWWATLLLQNYRGETGELPPNIDCTGVPIAWNTQGANGSAVQTGDGPLPPAPLTDADVAVSELPDRWRLVWVKVRRFSDGQAEGPVALVEPLRPSGWAVRSIGTMRALADHVRLRMVRVASQDVLVAEGQACREGGTECVRSAQLMPRRGGRFVPEPLMVEGREQPERAWVHLSFDHEWRANQLQKRMALSAELRFRSEDVAVHETLVESERDPQSPSTPPTVTRRVQVERRVRLERGKWVADLPSLLSSQNVP